MMKIMMISGMRMMMKIKMRIMMRTMMITIIDLFFFLNMIVNDMMMMDAMGWPYDSSDCLLS